MSDDGTRADGLQTAPFKYRAFISYSSRDADWAKWLHRALERYRVPRELVGLMGRDGPIPATLYPIFRDRDDLSAAVDLNAMLLQALAQSAALIVICSTNATASRWVDQEVAEFKRLGRQNRIHCLIVDPSDAFNPKTSFVPSLLHPLLPGGGLDITTEVTPLAADVRPHADGREPAKLKIIAGLLGIPLATLLQRERAAARRRRHMAMAVVSGFIALASLAALSAWRASDYLETAQNRLMPGIRVENVESVLDLKGWKPTTDQDLAENRKVSSATFSNTFSVVRTQDYATEFIRIVGTNSPIAPDVKCPNCLLRARRRDAAARAPYEWDVVFNIKDVPLEVQKFCVESTTLWNAFQTPAQWWAGFRSEYSTELGIFTIVFPDGKHPRPETLAYYYFASRDHPFTVPQQTAPVLDAQGRVEKLTWTIANPVADRSYRVKWVWD